MLRTVRLGDSALSVGQVGLGCLGMSGTYGPCPSENESIATINRALDIGVSLLDTADIYGAGHNEELIGRAIRRRRQDATVATKVGNILDADGKLSALSGHPRYVLQACDASLRRLGIAVIDLLYLHRVDPQVPIEETVGAMGQLVAAGKVRYIGLSEASEATIRRAHATWPVTALQTEYSLWWRGPEHGALQICRELGISFVAYAPLGRGMLTGSLTSSESLGKDDHRRNHPRFQGENFESNRKAVEQIVHVAEARGRTAAQVALAWLLQKGANVVPIPGAKSIRHLEDNLGAAGIELSNAEVAELEAAFPLGSASGARYPESGLAVLEG